VLPQDILEKAEVPAICSWNGDGPHLITVGRLYHAKGIDIAARACKVLKDRGLKFCWHVYGDGIMRDEISRYVEQNGLQAYFILEGATQNPYPYMKKADLLVQPSRVEGKSIVLDEARILGKAIVVTNYPSVYDQIEDGVTGIITGMEPEQIADGIQRILEDPDLKKHLEENCLQEPNRSIRAVNAFYDMIGA
jgi:glycosyltransferase involved in cell wall biosynthesis